MCHFEQYIFVCRIKLQVSLCTIFKRGHKLFIGCKQKYTAVSLAGFGRKCQCAPCVDLERCPDGISIPNGVMIIIATPVSPRVNSNLVVRPVSGAVTSFVSRHSFVLSQPRAQPLPSAWACPANATSAPSTDNTEKM